MSTLPMRRPTRLQLVHGSLALFAVALILRAAQVQLLQADVWRHRAQRQQFAAADVPAPRGNIFDVIGIRNGLDSSLAADLAGACQCV